MTARRGAARSPGRSAGRSVSVAGSRIAPQGRWLDPREPYVVPLLLGLAFRLYWATFLDSAAEDAYITLRYAENWAAGLGPVYNPGERVMGYSSPLWTAWLALGALLFHGAFLWGRLWGVVFDLAALVLGAHVLRRECGRASAWAMALFYALWPTFGAMSVLGMETSLFAFLLIATAWATTGGRAAGGVLLGLLALTRPEAVVSAGVVALGASWRQRLVGAGVAAAGVAALTLYYGTPIPASVSGKAVTYGTEGLRGAWTWLAGFVPALLGSWPSVTEAQHLVVLSLVFTPAAVVAAAQIWKRPGAARLVGAGGLVVLAGYAALGVPFFAWYLVIPILGWAWLAAIGLPSISRHPVLWVALLIFVLGEMVPLRHLYGGRAWAEEGFRGVGIWLSNVSHGRGTVFLEPIGHVGYVCRMRVIDEVGLVSPSVRARRARGDGWYHDTVLAESPDYLVVRPGQLEGNQAWAGRGAPFRTPAERDAVLQSYEHAYAGPEYELLPLRILRRRAALVPAAASPPAAP